MRPIHHAIDVSAPPAIAWAVLTDLPRWPAFFPYAVAARPLGGTPWVQGGGFVLELAVTTSRRLEVSLEVTAIDPPRLLRLRGRGFGVRGEHRYTIEGRGPWTRVTFHDELGGAAARLLPTALWDRLDRLAHRSIADFARLVEAQVSAGSGG